MALTPNDEFLLARLYISVGEWPQARRRLTALAAANPNNALFVSSLVAGLVRFDADTKEARKYLAALEKLQPDAAPTVELTARVLDAEGKPDAAAAVLVAFAQKDAKNVAPAAAVLDSLGHEKLAEPLYRRLAADPARPEAAFLLAGNLGRCGRTGEALEVVRGAAAKFPPALVAAAGVEILNTAPRIEPADAKQVEAWVAAVPATAANRAAILELTGTLRTVQERYGEAVEAYRELIALVPQNAAHLNNIAYLLGVREGKFDEAMGFLDKAKRIAGPRPLYRDTEGLILLQKGDVRAAIEVLGAAARETHDAVAYFHLALAHDKAGEARDSSGAMGVAKRLKLRPRDVIPGERRDLARLLARA